MREFNRILSVILFISLFIGSSYTDLVAQSLNQIRNLKQQQFLLNSAYKLSYNNLLKFADVALRTNYKTVLDKEILPVSNNRNDYFSTAVYYWENPDTKDGKPWVSNDGKYNGPALKKTDHSNYYKAMEAIRDLSLAYEYSYNSKFAEKAIFIIEQWFISDSTKMNPHLNYAQSIPGVTDGHASGIIDSRAILWVVNSISILKQTEYWTKTNDLKFRQWVSSFLRWLLASEFGKKEAKSKNNHGTFYDLQISTFASFVGRNKLAKTTIENAKTKRIEIQIKPDGSMPEELKRTRTYKYSLFSLSAFFHLAMLAERFEIDLWNYKTEKCGSIKDAFNFVITNAITNDNWEYPGKVDKSKIIGMLHIANEYIDNSYLELQNSLLEKGNFKKISDIYFVQ